MTKIRPLLLLLAAASTLAVLGLASGPSPAQQGDAAQVGVPVDVAVVTTRQLPSIEEFTGRLESAQFVEVRARVSGPVIRVHVQDGSVVSAGDVLFTIDPRPFDAELARAEAAAAAALAQREAADRELRRSQSLRPLDAVSAQETEQLAAAASVAAAAQQQAAAAVKLARLNVEHTRVRAPISGQLSRIDATVGHLVDSQRILTTLVDTRRLHAWFDVSEATYLRLRQNLAVQRRVRMALADETGWPRSGQVDFIDNRLNPQTATIRIRAAFDNTGGQLVPGLFARIQVETAPASPRVVVPDQAIGTDQDRRFVWVVGVDRMATARPVIIGRDQGGLRLVERGLSGGETIVVGGLQRVRPGVLLAPRVVPTDQPSPASPNASGVRS